VSKTEPPEDVLVAVRTVHADGVHLSKNILNIVVRQFASGVLADGNSPVQHLADRELEVFELIGQGKSTKEIAAILRLDVKTIETYRVRTKKKLGFKNATELHQSALKWMESKNM
jgi:DNA-binding NarL/FixJ family response regulator